MPHTITESLTATTRPVTLLWTTRSSGSPSSRWIGAGRPSWKQETRTRFVSRSIKAGAKPNERVSAPTSPQPLYVQFSRCHVNGVMARFLPR
jgi:hypothetical protein